MVHLLTNATTSILVMTTHSPTSHHCAHHTIGTSHRSKVERHNQDVSVQSSVIQD